ncbi:MAG: glycosyltransferase family 39 protein [bacterium]
MDKNILKSISRKNWILIGIVLIGIFLRSYNFEQWLYFYPDQSRDVTIVDDFMGGKESLPLLGFKAASTNFQLGAMYSYFQIISAKIFGSSPASVAYPDLFFGILTIPLLYYFLKKYFSINFALILAGLYNISFYAVRYSRFAWNTNPMPFFVLLFLLSLHEFLFSKGKTSWWWILLAGISVGVGVQLHTVLLVLFPIMSLLAFAYIIKFDRSAWKKCVAIFLFALLLNAGQILSEVRNEFANTGYFFNVLGERSPEKSNGLAANLVANVICQAQSNVLYLSSMENNDNCDALSSFKYDKSAKSNPIAYFVVVISLLFGLIISAAGYCLIAYYLKRENDNKKRLFLGLILLYGTLTFLIILPIITHNGQVRYWMPVMFLPFLFLGLIGKFLFEKTGKRVIPILFLLVLVLIGLNFWTTFSEAKQNIAKTRSNAQYVVLGELENINAYIISQAGAQREAYIFGGQKYMQNFYRPLFYVASKNNFVLNRGPRDPKKVPEGVPIFFIGQSLEMSKNSKYDSVPEDAGLKVKSYKGFGNIGVYQVTN